MMPPIASDVGQGKFYQAGPRVRRGVAAQRDAHFNLGALRFD